MAGLYESYYKPAMILLRDGILTYEELKKLTDDEFREVFYAYSLLREEEDEAVSYTHLTLPTTPYV